MTLHASRFSLLTFGFWFWFVLLFWVPGSASAQRAYELSALHQAAIASGQAMDNPARLARFLSRPSRRADRLRPVARQRDRDQMNSTFDTT